MDILVFSDSHFRRDVMKKVINQLKGKTDTVLHAGDLIDDAFAMQSAFPEHSFYAVTGNCDINHDGPEEILFETGGKKIFMAHGHQYGVKGNNQNIVYAAMERKADICIFGHTHSPDTFIEKGIYFMNPGSISLPKGLTQYPTYGLIRIDSGSISLNVIEVRGEAYKPLKSINS